MALISHGISDIGCQRLENQDRILLADALGLYIVCDGVGGRRRGDLAAEIAIDSIREFIVSSADPMEVTWPYGYNLQLSFAANRVLTAVKLANRQVWRRAENSLQLLGMGATVVMLLVDGTAAVVANVGDSRAYRFRNRLLEQLSVDDTASMRVMETNSPDSVARSILTKAVGSEQNVDVHLKQIDLAPGDTLLLCSDGLHGSVIERQIASLLAVSQPAAARTEALIGAARTAGAPDNVSALILDFEA